MTKGITHWLFMIAMKQSFKRSVMLERLIPLHKHEVCSYFGHYLNHTDLKICMKSYTYVINYYMLF